MTLPIRCELFGHKPTDIDPTGGDPWMGGPVAITICQRCGQETAAVRHCAGIQRRAPIRGGPMNEEAVRASVERIRPITPTYHAVVAGQHLDHCIACLIISDLDAALSDPENTTEATP